MMWKVPKKKLKTVICLFEQICRLKINFHKRKCAFLGFSCIETGKIYEETFTCEISRFPIKYLGFLLTREELGKMVAKNTDNKFEHRLSCWHRMGI